MYSAKDIIARAWLVKEITNSVLLPDELYVDKIFVVGSYASGKQTPFSDLDFLVQLKGGKQIGIVTPPWKKIQEINRKVNTPKIHIIFGTKEAAESLHKKHMNGPKDYSYRELNLKEIDNATSRSASSTQ